MEDRRKYENGDEEEEYIDMELLSTSPTQQTTEFEFQMSLTSTTKPPATSSADELFFNGQLLPLHHPRRHAATPCRPSCYHDGDDFFEWSNELNSFINTHPIKTPWPKKLKLLKLTSIVALKLKASTTFLRSFFSKTPCSDAIKGAQLSKIPTIASIMKSSIDINEDNLQRRSFSGAVKRHSSSASSSGASSSSSSFSLGGSHDQLHCLRRSSSATEIEGSIEAAIAHCKKSHQVWNIE